MIEGIADLHVHSGPSLVARHGLDSETVDSHRNSGESLIVLKAHEGCSAARAAQCGPGVFGGVVLNSPVGGANPDAVEVCAELGGRIVWLPTVSARSHKTASDIDELRPVHGIDLSEVPVVNSGKMVPEWHDVFDVVAAHDMVLASGHVPVPEALVVFRHARGHGVTRLMVNHPQMPFMRFNGGLIQELADLQVHVELGILPDLLVGGAGIKSADLARSYPTELLVFGSDLGHKDYPTLGEALGDWIKQVATVVGDRAAETILTTNGRQLLF